MSPALHPDHPDAGAKPGDKQEAAGRIWTFGQNQFSSFWVAGPKDGRVVCSKDYPVVSNTPYLGDGLSCTTFEKAAERSMRGAKREYEKALEVVRRYEAPEKGA